MKQWKRAAAALGIAGLVFAGVACEADVEPTEDGVDVEGNVGDDGGEGEGGD